MGGDSIVRKSEKIPSCDRELRDLLGEDKIMAFMQIGSNNPQFSYILKKNPANMIVRSLKEGRLFGYYSSAATIFNCFFKDADWSISYKSHKEDSFEYLNPRSFSAPEFVLDTITEFLAHIIKKENDGDVDGFDTFVMINMISIKKKYLDIFSKYFSHIEIDAVEVCPGNYRIKFSSKGTLKEIISFVQLFTIFNVLKNRTLTDEEISKYMNQLLAIKAPYMMLYVFKCNVLRDRKTFNLHKKTLEANAFEKVEFEFGFLQQQRIQTIEKLVDFNNDIYDIGCGEGQYVKALAHRLADGKKYHAIDKDPEMREVVAKRFAMDNVEIGSLFLTTTGDCTVIISEVIEHMPIKDAEQFVRDMLLIGGDDIKKMIITTPNASFNSNYFDDENEMRHDDHHFEMTKDEFVEWMPKVIGNKTFELLEIGDRVDGHCSTIGAVIS